MKTWVLLSLLISIGFPCSPLFATENNIISPPAGGIPILQGDVKFRLAGRSELGTSKTVDVQGLPFAHAVEVCTLKQPEKAWDLQLETILPNGFKKGDVLWISVWMRATETSNESHQGVSELTIDQAVPPGDRVTILGLDADQDWQQYAWAITSSHTCGAGQVRLALRVGFKPQTVQLGGLQILNYGPSVRPGDLPHSTIKYPGMELDAPWRKEAADRIERFRKADIKVNVTDAEGKPLIGATVRIQQLRHAFGFGSAVVPALINGTGADSEHYRQIIKDGYSKVVFENALKWRQWDEGAADGHKDIFASLQWLHDQGIEVRGHNLVWPSWRFTPAELAAYKNDPAGLEQHIESHITDEVGVLKGQLSDWDVVNEPYAQHNILDILGAPIMAKWFSLAHAADPKPDLVLNDYAGFLNGGDDTPHKDSFEKTLRALKDEGAPITGLGIQAHLGAQLTGPAQIVKELDRWAALGLKIQITEFDVDVPDEKVQAQYTRDFMTAVFSHPAVDTLLTWGFWEGDDWIPRAALYRKDWSIKPNGEAWNDLVLKQWHTDFTADTDAAGSVSTRGFMGQYRVTVTYHGASKTWPLTLSKEGVTLPASM